MAYKHLTLNIIFITSLLFAGKGLDISDVAIGARPMGMGRAFVAMANDPSAMYMNPAGLGMLQGINFHSMHTRLLNDIDYNDMGGTMPFANGSLGSSFLQASVGDIPLTVLDSNSRPLESESVTYRDIVWSVSYGTSVKSLFEHFLNTPISGELYGGLTGKYFYKGVPSLADGWGINGDLGLLYTPNDQWSFGIMKKNFLSYLGGLGDIHWEGNEDKITSLTKVGVAYYMLPNWVALADVDFAFSEDQKALIHLGTEHSFKNILAIRFGWEQLNDSIQGQTDGHLTAGFSVKMDNLIIDYGYQPYYGLEDNTTHYISIQYKFYETPAPSLEFIKEQSVKETPADSSDEFLIRRDRGY